MASNRERQREGDRDKKRKRGFAERERRVRSLEARKDFWNQRSITGGRSNASAVTSRIFNSARVVRVLSLGDGCRGKRGFGGLFSAAVRAAG